MFRLAGKISVDAPPKRVSAFLADPENEKRWQTGVVHVLRTAGAQGVAGATYERVQDVGGKNIKTETKLTDHTEGRSVVFEHKGKIIAFHTRYGLSQVGAGTQVEMRLEGEMLGFAAMFESMAVEALEKELPKVLARLPAAVTG